jgi:excisionase family DNA binding protein
LNAFALDVLALARAIAEVARQDPDVRRTFIAALGLDAPRSELMSVAEAAAHARVHADTVRRWIREGKLAEQRAGRTVRVRRAELEQLFAAPPPRVVRKGQRRPDGRFVEGKHEAAPRKQPSPEELAMRDYG